MLCHITPDASDAGCQQCSSSGMAGMAALRFQNHLTGTEAYAQAWGDAHQPLLPVCLTRRPLTLLLQG